MADNTESTCEVVLVQTVDVHPNADRLELVKFSFKNGIVPDYQVVTRRGDFKPGDLAVYISDDMMVPVDRPEFVFLKDKAKGGYHRVRACRLRGVMSTGFLIHNEISGSLGEDVADKLGVIKYVSPLEKSATAQSVSTPGESLGLFARIFYSVIRRLYTPAKIPDYSVLSLRKVPNLFQEGEPVIVTEKIHGINIRFGRVGSRIFIGSHHTEKSDSRPWFLRLFNRRKRGPGYYGTDVWSKWFNRHFASDEQLRNLPRNIIFYGELYGAGIQPWTYGLFNTQVVLFDAYHVTEKRWLSWPELVSFSADIGVDMAPTLAWSIPYSRETIKNLSEHDSALYGGPSEGVVVRSADWKRAGKLVSDRYLESNH